MKSEITNLLQTFDHSMYDQKYAIVDSCELFPLDKWELYLRFRIAFQHGYLGIRYDDQYDRRKIQHTLDQLFECSPHEAVQCRRLLNGHTVIYPNPRFFDIDIKKYPWSFIRHYQRFCDFSFPSQHIMTSRRQLMTQIRRYRRCRIPSLYTKTFMHCSTQEMCWLREMI
jgi:hypothetical protein